MADREWSTEEQRWVYPDEYEPGQPPPTMLRTAFWEAMKRCGDDPRVHDMAYPYNDDPKIDGDIPVVLWEHMAGVLAEFRAAAGLGQPQ